MHDTDREINEGRAYFSCGTRFKSLKTFLDVKTGTNVRIYIYNMAIFLPIHI